MHPKNTIGRAVERIQDIISFGYDNKILFIKSEDFAAYPDTTMKLVYDYLELPYYEHDFDNIQQITTEDDEVYGLTNDLHTIRPKLEIRPSDANRILDNHVRNYLFEKWRWYYDKFRYEK
jgi:sulfotransferase